MRNLLLTWILSFLATISVPVLLGPYASGVGLTFGELAEVFYTLSFELKFFLLLLGATFCTTILSYTLSSYAVRLKLTKEDRDDTPLKFDTSTLILSSTLSMSTCMFLMHKLLIMASAT